jgi:uncharacterized protein YhhL (DUF1145 family)
MAKALVAALWLFGIGSFFVAPETAAAGIGRKLFLALVLAHALECAIFLPRLRTAGGSLPNHLLQTFVFGIAHVSTLPKADAGRAG